MRRSREARTAREALRTALGPWLDEPVDAHRHEELERSMDVLMVARDRAMEDGHTLLVRAIDNAEESIRRELIRRQRERERRNARHGRGRGGLSRC